MRWRAIALALALVIAASSVDAKPRKKRGKSPRVELSYKKRPKAVRIKRTRTVRIYFFQEDSCPMLSPEDRDLIIRTVMGEANSEPYVGKVAVAAVVKNRIADGNYGRGVQGVLFRPKQFEPWNTRRGELLRYGPNTRGWAEAEAAVDDAFMGGADPTGGATHFANVSTVIGRNNSSAMRWITRMGNKSRIGNHTFGNADAGSDRRGGIRTVDTGDDMPRVNRGRSDVMRALGLFDDDDIAEGDSYPDFASMIASLDEPTDDPRRLAVRGLISELLEDLTPADFGQGHAVAPSDGGAVLEDLVEA